jgi:hypothetical protein
MLDTIVLLGGALMVGAFFTILALVVDRRERRRSRG